MRSYENVLLHRMVCGTSRFGSKSGGGVVVCFLGKSNNQGRARKQKILSDQSDVDKSSGCILMCIMRTVVKHTKSLLLLFVS